MFIVCSKPQSLLQMNWFVSNSINQIRQDTLPNELRICHNCTFEWKPLMQRSYLNDSIERCYMWANISHSKIVWAKQKKKKQISELDSHFKRVAKPYRIIRFQLHLATRIDWLRYQRWRAQKIVSFKLRMILLTPKVLLRIIQHNRSHCFTSTQEHTFF